jgi:hypothetical protein
LGAAILWFTVIPSRKMESAASLPESTLNARI